MYKEGDKYVKIGGLIQLQYHLIDPAGGETSDEVLFRGLRPCIEGNIHKDWKGKFQWDMDKAEGEREVFTKTKRLLNSKFPIRGIDSCPVQRWGGKRGRDS